MPCPKTAIIDIRKADDEARRRRILIRERLKALEAGIKKRNQRRRSAPVQSPSCPALVVPPPPTKKNAALVESPSCPALVVPPPTPTPKKSALVESPSCPALVVPPVWTPIYLRRKGGAFSKTI